MKSLSILYLFSNYHFYFRNNTEYMITVGLNLLTVALEVGADYLANYPLLLSIVKDSLCRNLLSVRFLELQNNNNNI